MPRNEDGEFELVLGNRQLLSGFFIVVILFGVFFTMGYIVGRHSSPTPTVSPSAAASSQPAQIASAPAPTSATSSASLPPGEIEVLPATKPATESGAPAQAAETAPASVKPSAVAAVQSNSDGELSAPQAGKLYVQVRVGTRPALSGVVDALKRKGIPAFLAPGPDPNSVRVLVGPFEDQPAMAKTRAEVQDAGFKDAFPKRY